MRIRRESQERGVACPCGGGCRFDRSTSTKDSSTAERRRVSSRGSTEAELEGGAQRGRNTTKDVETSRAGLGKRRVGDVVLGTEAERDRVHSSSSSGTPGRSWCRTADNHRGTRR